MLEETGVTNESKRLTPSHWQLSHMPLPRFESGLWCKTASSQCQCLRPHSHQGAPWDVLCSTGMRGLKRDAGKCTCSVAAALADVGETWLT